MSLSHYCVQAPFGFIIKFHKKQPSDSSGGRFFVVSGTAEKKSGYGCPKAHQHAVLQLYMEWLIQTESIPVFRGSAALFAEYGIAAY